MKQAIEIVPYNPSWPNIFKTESILINKALGDNCITIHHIGSTAVPNLMAKPIIDILPVVYDISLVNSLAMEDLGYTGKGEYGIPSRQYFKKEGFNVHIFEIDNLEIEKYIKFRDWLRSHEEDRMMYENLKLTGRFQHDPAQYSLGKTDFIKKIDKKAG